MNIVSNIFDNRKFEPQAARVVQSVHPNSIYASNSQYKFAAQTNQVQKGLLLQVFNTATIVLAPVLRVEKKFLWIRIFSKVNQTTIIY